MEAVRTAYGSELDNLRATELRLGLPGTEEEPQKPAPAAAATRGIKRALAEVDEDSCRSMTSSTCTVSAGSSTEDDFPEAAAPPAKAQVVGWPPIRSYRKNCLQARKAEAEPGAGAPGLYVKVSMDGAPYLRKIDLNVFRGYKELREALEAMFKCFSIGFSAGEARATADYAITYEDKDGDWMLAGDVPWEMFTSSCRRLRIMRGSEARGFGSSS